MLPHPEVELIENRRATPATRRTGAGLTSGDNLRTRMTVEAVRRETSLIRERRPLGTSTRTAPLIAPERGRRARLTDRALPSPHTLALDPPRTRSDFPESPPHKPRRFERREKCVIFAERQGWDSGPARMPTSGRRGGLTFGAHEAIGGAGVF